MMILLRWRFTYIGGRGNEPQMSMLPGVAASERVCYNRGKNGSNSYCWRVSSCLPVPYRPGSPGLKKKQKAGLARDRP